MNFDEARRQMCAVRNGGSVTKPVVSILIVNWNTRELVLKCLDSLQDNVGDVPFKVIVVDNGSVDGSADFLERRPDTFIRNDRNLGFALAVNQPVADRPASLCCYSTPTSIRDLSKTLSGDVGPLPSGPASSKSDNEIAPEST